MLEKDITFHWVATSICLELGKLFGLHDNMWIQSSVISLRESTLILSWKSVLRYSVESRDLGLSEYDLVSRMGSFSARLCNILLPGLCLNCKCEDLATVILDQSSEVLPMLYLSQ